MSEQIQLSDSEQVALQLGQISVKLDEVTRKKAALQDEEFVLTSARDELLAELQKLKAEPEEEE